MQSTLAELTAALAAHADDHDRSGDWPEAALAAYAAAGGWAWSVPEAHGGAPLPVAERLSVYVALARGDMSTALFMTQHDGAVDLIAACDNAALKAEALPRFARGEAMTTIGYSQLTTSQAAGAAALTARREGDAWILDGVMPWVTGAPRCESVLAGAACPDGTQVLLLVPLRAAGIAIGPPIALLALDSSQTCRVECTGARVSDSRCVAGPEPQVLARRSPERILHVSATGIGLLWGIVDRLRVLEQRPVPGEGPPSAALAPRVEALHARLMRCADWEAMQPSQIDALRSEINDLLVRAGGVLLTLAKGTGYTRANPAQRLAREALFFCVWSATDAVRARTLARLLAAPEGGG